MYVQIMFGYKEVIDYDNNKKFIFCRDEMIKWTKENYQKFNSLFFDNILPDYNDMIFEITNSKSTKSLGLSYNTRPYKIRINFRYDLPEIEYQDTLIHEMIHIWQFIMGYTDSHGKSFKKKAKEINKYGWNIQSTYKNILINLKDVRE